MELSIEDRKLGMGFVNSFKPKIVETRNGGLAVIYADSANAGVPILGVYYTGEEWIPMRWMSDGRCPSINEKVIKTGLDLLLDNTTTNYFTPQIA